MATNLLNLCYNIHLMTDDIKESKLNAEETASKDDELIRNKVAHMLEFLGEDVVNDMLKASGLEEEIELQDDSTSQETVSLKNPTGKKTKPSLRKKISKRLFFLILFIAILLVPVAINQIMMMVTINSNDPIQYTEDKDVISCSDGFLHVNNVSVAVPTDGNEKYSISYTWSEEDKDYPSVPHAINAVYKDKAGDDSFSISLYKNETVPKDQIPEGKTAENWFDEWKGTSTKSVTQKALKSKNVNGFYISPATSKDGDSSGDYTNYSYYFAVPEDAGISIYVLEGNRLNENSEEVLPGIMDKCIQSITIKKSNEVKS